MAHDADKASAVARRLLAGWEERTKEPLVGARGHKFTQQELAVVYGLVAHVHYLGAPALDLLDAGLVLAAIPLIRSAYESAITAQWVIQTADGAAAFLNEDLRQRRNHVTTLEQAASEVFRKAASEVAARIIEDLETSASARRFDEICDDLTPGGKDAYVIYRSMSHLSHATVLVVDQYLEHLDEPPNLALRTQPDEPDRRTWTHLLAASLVWAGRANDILDKHHRRRKELRAAARELEVPVELQRSERAITREGPRQRP